MNIRYIKTFICGVCICCGGATTFTACSDYLDILPMNDVVLENYWTEKSDVASVLNGCYESLESRDCLTRMALWGEVRSDNMYLGSNVPWELEQLIKENILPTNSYCTWTPFYQTINRCNTVCYYAPKVQQIDPNYTYTEMRANIAEATAIRSLCYFYLIRTFRDVPFTRRPSIDDTENFQLPATKFDAVLDSLITDLEAVKDEAVRRYYTDDNDMAYTNTSRFTRTSIYALLADLYLWQGNWDKCIEHCQYVLDQKQLQYNEMRDRDGNIYDIQLFGEWPLIMERPVGSNISGHVYNEVFGTGNSFESIFELYFSQSQSVHNYLPPMFFMRGTTLGRIGVNDEEGYFFGKIPETKSTLFELTDCRAYESLSSVSSNTCGIAKYVNQSVSFNTMGTITATTLRLNTSPRSYTQSGNDYYCSANWIVYRMTDVMLMMAEAYTERGTDDDLDKAFALINAVNRRANNIFVESNSILKRNDYPTQAEMRDLVMMERQRELLFEGKRWYDLVRVARRQGNTRELASTVVKKQKTGKDAIRIKLADDNAIYLPYSRSELKVNPYLTQNPAYNTGDDADLEKN